MATNGSTATNLALRRPSATCNLSPGYADAFPFTRRGAGVVAILMMALLAGCAGSVATPTLVARASPGFDPAAHGSGEYRPKPPRVL